MARQKVSRSSSSETSSIVVLARRPGGEAVLDRLGLEDDQGHERRDLGFPVAWFDEVTAEPSSWWNRSWSSDWNDDGGGFGDVAVR